MTREQDRYRLIAHLLGGHSVAVLVLRAQEHCQEVVTVAAVRLSSSDDSRNRRVEALSDRQNAPLTGRPYQICKLTPYGKLLRKDCGQLLGRVAHDLGLARNVRAEHVDGGLEWRIFGGKRWT